MKHTSVQVFALCVAVLASALSLAGQNNSEATGTMPRLINYSGKVADSQGRPIAGVAGVTFSIYKEQEGGAALWMETQNVQADGKGNYTAQLGATKAQGLPVELFSSGQARWLGVRINNGEEAARVLLLSVPYAMKAADAETIGGLPPSAFVLAAPPVSANAGAASTASSSASAGVTAAVSGSGTTNYLPLWTPNGTTLGSSVLFQSGTGTTAKIGINTATPATTLDVKGGTTVRGALSLPVTGSATATAGKNSQPETFTASAFNSSSSAAVNQVFRLQAEPASNDTASPSGTLNFLYGSGSATPAETGLKISSKGVITFATGQTFPGGSGTVTSVGLSAPTSDFTVSGSPVTTKGTLALKWTTAPTANNTANAIVKRDSTGSFNASTVNLVALNANNSSGLAIIANATGNAGILGGSDTNSGVAGTSVSGDGVFGDSVNGNGVEGDSSNGNAFGVYGTNSADDSIAIYGIDNTSSSIGVAGIAPYAVVGNGSILAGLFNGNVEVNGTLSKDGGSFKIDHPLDPANKYLYHSFVESPDMMNIYNGNVTTDAKGVAVITLPDWFEALNRDFRYQLTVLGQFAQAIVSSEVANHQFSIKTDKPNVKVSWQVTGIRQDAWANAHRIPVEEMKPVKERGFYKHPELYNAPADKSVVMARLPRAMTQGKTARANKLAPVARNLTEKTPGAEKP